MNKLIKFLKPFGASVLAILLVLIVQVYCDLSLPTYTSNIVNVGIQQKGISEKVPHYISEEDMGKLQMVSSPETAELLQESYEKDEKHSTEKVPVLKLKKSVKDNDAKREKLEDAVEEPMFLIMAASQAAAEADKSGEAGANAQAAMDPAAIQDKLKDIPDTMLEQATAVYIQGAYENANVNLEKMQNNYILKTGAKMLGLAAIGMVASVIVGFLAARTGAGVGKRLRGDVYKKVVGFSNSEYDKFSTASLITRSSNDIQQIQMITIIMLRMVLMAPIMALGGVWKVFHTNVDMVWIIGVGIIAVLTVVMTLFIAVMPKFKLVQKLVDRVNLVSRELLTGLQVIRAFNTEDYEEKRFDKANKDLMKTQLFVNRAMTFMMPMMILIMNGITVLITWNGAHGINEGTMQVGDMMAFIQYTMQIIMSFLMISMISVMLPRAAVSAVRVDEVLTSETMIKDPKSPKTLPESGKGEIEFKDVHFRYPNAEEDVIEGVSFVATPGETTAIIGSTGSGKSTMINLIPRFYDVTGGQILIDGVDIREVTQHNLRKDIGYVPQKGVLFSGTIRSNILYSDPENGEEVMKEAADIAQATEFITQKENGYDSPIAQGGTNVSGGQKQRLSIARAIAGDPKIYIFDDSFSALDYKTDVTLRKELAKKTKDATVLIVAQRISTIAHAEKILVLDDGKIVGEGTHKELLRNCEAYHQIAASQLSESELAEDMKEVG
ncbi:ABC transporter ATP-binding protein [Ohessyouella blattaphilus]|uniref:ABC transporter ATP-binding protein/permease n=1 Tax=Ohessyouella blattaphilus TaxID=2949333 RepID=A0ABT1EHL4_9FIRM|nr:ABC transporter ATP-binding protein [Ohessyouella blattaphilus]MCP1110184.1 ABC transporter ATP-binding protein/permease [Ohessyouella blattaphilus]MCR8563578.1 ABC transporter ATP-binding protein/permease [Ohessyouella blattaphilus]